MNPDKFKHFRPVDDKPQPENDSDKSADGYVRIESENRDWEEFYRNRWNHDKIVRSTHGVNCTGSCSWRIFVKNGVVTWEMQQTDYPRNNPGMPNHEPRGCPRGASYSWYLYNSGRVKHPMIRAQLLEAYLGEKKTHPDPVDAWEAVQNNPKARESYVTRRGLGGFVRVDWELANEIIAAANIYTIKKYGPDRISGFSPIPAFSMVSYGAGTRYLSLIGGTCLSFYDFYCDLPPASPQTWGEQTDVPESADWYNSTYLVLWGSNVPVTRTPDSPFFTQARYNGTKTVVVAPDFNDAAKFADIWVSTRQGTDSALGMAMGHVILKEFYIKRQFPYLTDYARRFTDLPYLVKLEKKGDAFRPGMMLRSSDFKDNLGMTTSPDWKPVMAEEGSGAIMVPVGSIGSRWDNNGTWNLETRDLRDNSEFTPGLSVIDRRDAVVDVMFPYFGGDQFKNPHFNAVGNEVILTRKVPAVRIDTGKGEILCCTVFDLMVANYGVERGLNDPACAKEYTDVVPFTPAWQEEITGVKAATCERIAREFAENAVATEGRSMIIVGAGINQWFNTDMTYRSIINVLVLCGTVGKSGGGWSHYVGQEKIRPMAGWGVYSFAADWVHPTRQMNATTYFYQHTDQWRYDKVELDTLLSPVADHGKWKGITIVDCNVSAQRMGWAPVAPQFDVNSLDIARRAKAEGRDPADYLCEKLHTGEINIASEDLDNPVNFPRNLFIWRSNLLGCSAKGMEYFMRHLLGTQNGVLGEDIKEAGYPLPIIEKWHDKAATGKLDLCVTFDFRMTTSSLHSDIVLPAATWYEKNDISSTDMHQFIHPFCAAVNPTWEARTDWNIFKGLAKKLSELSEGHLGKETDLVETPMVHDSPSEISQPLVVTDWKTEGTMPVPGKNFGNLTEVERDYSDIYRKFTSVGPRVATAGVGTKGVHWDGKPTIELLSRLNLTVDEDGVAKGQPRMETDIQAADTILMLSPESNGEVGQLAWADLEKRTGLKLAHLSSGHEADMITYRDVVVQPRRAFTSACWSGCDGKDICYNASYINVHELVPWRTLTGRQELYQDHPWMLDFGAAFATYRPPLDSRAAEHLKEKLNITGKTLTLNILTPHSKWGIHSTWCDNLLMLTLGRGGPVIWISETDAETLGIADNDWVEVFNDNGASVVRAVVSQRIPKGATMYYHNPERFINMPLSRITGNRGGLHNSISRICPNPTHMIGGYAQISYSFNYYGTIGANRDEFAIVRKLDNVDWE